MDVKTRMICVLVVVIVDVMAGDDAPLRATMGVTGLQGAVMMIVIATVVTVDALHHHDAVPHPVVVVADHALLIAAAATGEVVIGRLLVEVILVVVGAGLLRRATDLLVIALRITRLLDWAKIHQSVLHKNLGLNLEPSQNLPLPIRLDQSSSLVALRFFEVKIKGMK